MAEFNGATHDMATAEMLKASANALFQAHKYNQAIQIYNQAIELDPNNAVYYANRSFANSRLEAYGDAVADATKSIEIDPKYVKGHYRRGTAYLAMGKFEEGLRDFRQVCKIVPKDPDALKKLRQCEKAVAKARFERAIAQDGNNTINCLDESTYTTIEVDDSYKGPRIGDTITLDFVKQMIAEFKDQRVIHKRYAFQILVQTVQCLLKLPTVLDITIPDKGSFTICGDIHGQFYDMLNIFHLNGLPSDENPYLFNGDFVDRGSFSVECIFTLFAFKCLYPNGLHLIRGNHEAKCMNRMYGFHEEVKVKYNMKMADMFAEVFCCLPLASVLNEKIFVVHGGLFSTDGVKLSDIRALNRLQEPPEEGLMSELLWSDPHPGTGRIPSIRGVGVAFGSDVTHRFLEENNLELIVRSHEMKEAGYEVMHDGKLITIFSAPNYCDQMGNKGAYIKLEAPELKPKIQTFHEVKHPPTRRPMQFFG